MSAVQGRQTAERYGIKVKQNMGKKVVTFGEIMLRLAPEGYYRFVQAESFGATYGGGEANVAVSLANFGFDACFVTKLPAHEIGQGAVNSLRRFGMDTSGIVRGGDMVGIYFLVKHLTRPVQDLMQCISRGNEGLQEFKPSNILEVDALYDVVKELTNRQKEAENILLEEKERYRVALE